MVRVNNKMSSLMGKLGVFWPITEKVATGEPPKLELVKDCVLLKGEYDRNRHVTIESCIDRSGYEYFLNHAHLPFRETKESLIDCLSYAEALERALLPLAPTRRFRVVVAISDDDSTVRFNQCRSGEDPISEDLERFESEAILVFDVDTPFAAE